MAMLRCMSCMEEYNEKQNRCPHCGGGRAVQAAEPYHLMPGTVLQKRYVVGKSLRYNAKQIIYIGWDQVLAKKIAVREYFPIQLSERTEGEKEIYWRQDGSRESFLQGMGQFIDEAEQLARYREETGNVRIYDTFEENGTAYIVTEYSDSMRVGQAAAGSRQQHKKEKRWLRLAVRAGFGMGGVSLAVMLVLVAMEWYRGVRLQMDYPETGDNTMPDLTGLSFRQAEQKMQTLGVEVKETAYSLNDADGEVIIRQSISCGETVEDGMVVEVVVTKKPESDTAERMTEEGTHVAVEDTEDMAAESKREDTELPVTDDTEQGTTAATRQQTTAQRQEYRTTQRKQTTEKQTTEKRTTEKTTEKNIEKKAEKKTTENTQEVIVIED
ncbi:MAG: PASTA domain-containing protein [Lachnospiraceae bacterium]|nr:PASTA domain-containing protein [Lachnospiraceae bacterium]